MERAHTGLVLEHKERIATHRPRGLPAMIENEKLLVTFSTQLCSQPGSLCWGSQPNSPSQVGAGVPPSRVAIRKDGRLAGEKKYT